ncbi:MAG: 3-keto-disaccharide hydrolase [Thermoguttaceae bacterium]
MNKLLYFFAILVLLVSTLSRAEESFCPDNRLGAAPPSDAIVLFDGTDSSQFLHKSGKPSDWLVKNGELVVVSSEGRSNHILTKLHFRDADIHVEFNMSPTANGNSGIYIHGHYEMQIFIPTQNVPLEKSDIGGLYGFNPPLVMAGLPPGEWQVYDIRFLAPRRNSEGEIVQKGKITAWLNGKLVQDQIEFGEPVSVYHPYRYKQTPYLERIAANQHKTGVGPLFLQDHDSPCRFRNIWIKPLDKDAFVYEETAKK